MAGGFVPPTVVLPGGAGPARAAAPPPFGAQPAFDAAEARPGVNPLVDAASDLFDLVVYLQAQAGPVEIGALRAKAAALVRRFDLRAEAAGAPGDVIGVARYAIAATVDDQVMARPWGIASGWQHATLVGALYEEVIGGERFFEYLDAALKDPGRYGDLIEFLYICLSLGFQGVYRRRDREGLEAHRARAFQALRARRGGFAQGLSPRWRGVDAARRPLREIVPLWLVGALSAGLCGGALIWGALAIGAPAGRAVAAAAALPPPAEVEIATLDPPAAAPPRPAPAQQARVSGFLEAEIAAGLVEVLDEGGRVRIRLTGEGMFASAQATLLPRYEPVLAKVAAALDGEPGRVLVEGHSDAAPIRTARFPSNAHLSRARAGAVAAVLQQRLADPDRLDVEGLGDARPLDPANPRAAVNRRVELVLAREAAP
jgi:type VI secretion system protein ImpK